MSRIPAPRLSPLGKKIHRELVKSPAEWLQRAVSKDPARAWLSCIYGNTAANGYILHRVIGGRFTIPPDCPEEASTIEERFRSILEECINNSILVTVSRDALILACLRAIAISKGTCKRDDNPHPMMKLAVNGRLDYACSGPLAETSGWIDSQYHHTGEDVTFYVNPHYLLDVLSGMGETVQVTIRRPDCPIYVTDNAHEAVIMPMRGE